MQIFKDIPRILKLSRKFNIHKSAEMCLIEMEIYANRLCWVCYDSAKIFSMKTMTELAASAKLSN